MEGSKETGRLHYTMGIPSYFRKIIQAHPGTVRTQAPVVDTVCFDFNCLIYRCIRAPSMLPYPGGEGAPTQEDIDTWEQALLAEVCSTVVEIWKTAGSPATVYLAVDGVVPMAKIRQQRVRRFKSAWLSSDSQSWDTNAITPGTAFMDSLTTSLTALSHKMGWKNAVSGVREGGEGEHKIMRFLRSKANRSKSVCIYGLDADLILLSMLVAEETGKQIWLLREVQEFGSVAVAEKQAYCYMDVAMLKQKLYITGYQQLLNYIALMSLMGNDFLPHSITHKLSEDGHDLVLRELRTMTGGWQLVREVDGRQTIQVSVVQDIAKRWAMTEEAGMVHMIQKKQQCAKRPVRDGTDPLESLPLEWNVEAALCSAGDKRVALVEGWRDAYWKFVHPSCTDSLKQHACQEYIRGCQWILDYYTGRDVNMFWVYPYWVPPLWSDMAGACGTVSTTVIDSRSQSPITPEEQLAMVLPLKSWGLVHGPLRRLPMLLPQMWPSSFTFFSLGRKWLWECEARIPVLTAERLREMLTHGK